MRLDEGKMTLPPSALAEVHRAHSTAVGELLDPQRPRANVVGVGAGVKWKNGQPTGEPALVVLVTHKLAEVSAADLVPPKLADMQTLQERVSRWRSHLKPSLNAFVRQKAATA